MHDNSAEKINSIFDVLEWIQSQRKTIDRAVDNSAFTGTLEVKIPFSFGTLCVSLTRVLTKWNAVFSDSPIIFLIDEIENFSEMQQEVVNSLVRYGEGILTFRISGRLYSRKTRATVGNGEENREGSEFTTVELDSILRDYRPYQSFASKFISKRFFSVGGDRNVNITGRFDPQKTLQDIQGANFYETHVSSLALDVDKPVFFQRLSDAVSKAATSYKFNNSDSSALEKILADAPFLILQKLNALLFCKKLKMTDDPLILAREIANAGKDFVSVSQKGFYKTAYGHYAADLFAQLCRESKKPEPLYGGFKTFVQMSCGNPRNLLICFKHLYDIATFREIDFAKQGQKLSISMQSEAAIEAARFAYESDANYGLASEHARKATERLATVLRTARYALSIPEVSPLAVSFDEADVMGESRMVLQSALNYSFIFEINDGRPDRNSQRLNRKIQLNPLLAPKWGLPVSRRGDISLNKELVNAIFDPALDQDFKSLLKLLDQKWNLPFSSKGSQLQSQPQLFS